MFESCTWPTPDVEECVFTAQACPVDDRSIALRTAVEQGIEPGFQGRPALDLFLANDLASLGGLNSGELTIRMGGARGNETGNVVADERGLD